MKKILIYQDKILHYRAPIFNLLAQDYDVTVAYHVESPTDFSVKFNSVKLEALHFKRFLIHKNSLLKLSEQFDVIIGPSDIGWLKLMGLLFLRNRRFKIILWGIGVRASYKHNYGEKTKWDIVRYFLLRKADALIFYSEKTIYTYLNQGFDKTKLFVANNTIAVKANNMEIESRNNLLFIGTLYKEKKIYDLLESYQNAYSINTSLPKLNIIGDGAEFSKIKAWIINSGLQNLIFLRGKIFDESQLSEYFSQTLACISPGQAGLSVLKSMGYGVPFICSRDAITGGEIFNIEDGVSGCLYEEDDQLTDIILDIANQPEKYLKMGENAKKYYLKCRRPEDMANGIKKAIEHVL